MSTVTPRRAARNPLRLAEPPPPAAAPAGGLTFRIGPAAFAVRLTHTRPTLEGRSVYATVCYEDESITLFAGLPPRMRWNVLLHELAHAWRWSRPVGLDEEATVQDYANFAQEMRDQLDGQGGLDTLAELEPHGAGERRANGHAAIA